MKLRKRFEDLMVAISFAEANEHETARRTLKRERQTTRKHAHTSRRAALQRKELRTPSMYR